MPLLHITTPTLPAAPEPRGAILKNLSALLARILKKPEQYVMVALSPAADMVFGGSSGPTCYAELKNVGKFPPDEVEKLSEILCDALSQGFAVPKDRIYIEFTNADGAMWGWNGSTFA